MVLCALSALASITSAAERCNLLSFDLASDGWLHKNEVHACLPSWCGATKHNCTSSERPNSHQIPVPSIRVPSLFCLGRCCAVFRQAICSSLSRLLHCSATNCCLCCMMRSRRQSSCVTCTCQRPFRARTGVRHLPCAQGCGSAGHGTSPALPISCSLTRLSPIVHPWTQKTGVLT